jgi:hypothetical protein
MPTTPSSQPRNTLFLFTSKALFFAVALLCLSPAGTGQSAGINQGGSPVIHAPADPSGMPRGSSEAAAKVEQMRRAERQRRIAMDTAKLVELSNQVKSEIDNTPKDQLSVDTLRKTTEIEKTAHDLKSWLQS